MPEQRRAASCASAPNRSPVDEPEHEAEQDADQEARHDWEIEGEILALDDDVAEQAADWPRSDGREVELV
jgi:hypothetical protein